MIKRLINKIYKTFASPQSYARYVGVKIGTNCFIAIKEWSSEPYLIEIGSNVAITSGCRIHTHGGARVARRMYPNYDSFGRVVIKDWAYIGSGSQIMPGVTIGEGALVAAGSIVTKSVPPGMVVGGNPARVICTVDEYINRNMKYNLNTKPLSFEQKKVIILQSEDMLIKK